jgi:GxxExxY protein
VEKKYNPMTTQKEIDQLTYNIIGCAIEVHKVLGPGLLESIYEKCLVHELKLNGFDTKNQLSIPLLYKGITMDCDLRLDVLVNDQGIVELKAVDILHPIFEAQILTYMKLLQKPKGILINFNCKNIFHEGQKTYVNDYYGMLEKE